MQFVDRDTQIWRSYLQVKAKVMLAANSACPWASVSVSSDVGTLFLSPIRLCWVSPADWLFVVRAGLAGLELLAMMLASGVS